MLKRSFANEFMTVDQRYQNIVQPWQVGNWLGKLAELFVDNERECPTIWIVEQFLLDCVWVNPANNRDKRLYFDNGRSFWQFEAEWRREVRRGHSLGVGGKLERLRDVINFGSA
jgi:hypothetical protein